MRFADAYDPIRALTSAWALLQKAPATVLVGGILLTLLEGGGGGGGQGQFQGGGGRGPSNEEIALMLAIFAILVVVGIAMWLFVCLVRVGFASALEHTLKTGGDEVALVFKSEGRWLNMVLGTLLQALALVAAILPLMLLVGAAVAIGAATENPAVGIGIGAVALLVFLPVVVYVGLGLSLVPAGIAVEHLQPIEAFKRSWSLVGGNRWQLILYYLATGLFTMLGLCVCCIGVLFTGALANTAYYDSYLRLVRSTEEQEAWVGDTRPTNSVEDTRD